MVQVALAEEAQAAVNPAAAVRQVVALPPEEVTRPVEVALREEAIRPAGETRGRAEEAQVVVSLEADPAVEGASFRSVRRAANSGRAVSLEMAERAAR